MCREWIAGRTVVGSRILCLPDSLSLTSEVRDKIGEFALG
jgi:hypothetical protein